MARSKARARTNPAALSHFGVQGAAPRAEVKERARLHAAHAAARPSVLAGTARMVSADEWAKIEAMARRLQALETTYRLMQHDYLATLLQLARDRVRNGHPSVPPLEVEAERPGDRLDLVFTPKRNPLDLANLAYPLVLDRDLTDAIASPQRAWTMDLGVDTALGLERRMIRVREVQAILMPDGAQHTVGAALPEGAAPPAGADPALQQLIRETIALRGEATNERGATSGRQGDEGIEPTTADQPDDPPRPNG